MRVVDTHFHWFPRAHLERLCEVDGYPRAERLGDGFVYYYNDGRGRIDLPSVWLALEDGLEASARATGEDTAVICTTGVLGGLIDQLPTSVASDVAIAYNEEMAAAQRRHPGRVFGSAMIPLSDANEAIRVLDHAVKELGLLGANLPAISGTETIDAARLESFYDRVEELGVPLIVHPTDLVFGEVLTGYDDKIHLSLGRLLDSSMTVIRLIFSGIMHRHLELKILQTHAGALLPYQAGRLDKNARIKDLPLPVSEYLKRLYVDTVAPQALTIRTAVEFFGSDRVVYGTDYPCWSPAAAAAVIEESNLDETTASSIFSKNASAIFNLD